MAAIQELSNNKCAYRSDEELTLLARAQLNQRNEEEPDDADASKVRGKSAKRYFLSQAPACNPPSSQEALIANAKANAKAGLLKLIPMLLANMPEGPQKSQLEQLATGLTKMDPKSTPEKKSSDLFEYLTALMLFQISMGKAQTSIAQLNQNCFDAAKTLLTDALNKAQADLVTFQQQEESQQNTGLWSSILSIAGVVLGSAIFLSTGSPVLLVMSTANIITANVHTSDGNSLDQDLSLAIGSAAETVATGISTTLGQTETPAWLTTTFKDLMFAGIAAAETYVAGKVDASLVGDGEKAAEAATTLVNGTEKAAQVTKNSSFLGQMLLVSSTTGPLLPGICQQMAGVVFPEDKNNQAIFAACLQFTAGFAATMLGGKMNGTFQGQGITKMLSSALGEKTFERSIATLKLIQTGVNAAAAGCEVATGFTLRAESDTLNDQGKARYTVAATQGMIDSLQTTFSSTQSAFTGQNKDIADMSDLSDRLIPWDPNSYKG